MQNTKHKLAVLVSGSGTNLQAIIDAIENKVLQNAEIAVVASNKKNAFALTRAKNVGIDAIFLNPKEFENPVEYERKLIQIFKQYSIDFIILAGYLRILTEYLISAYTNKIINIHPALLPKYGGDGMYGKHVHQAVLRSGDKESGCTVHFVTKEVDKGQVIGQRKVPVYSNDTVETLAKRILSEEHKLLIESIQKVIAGKAGLKPI